MEPSLSHGADLQDGWQICQLLQRSVVEREVLRMHSFAGLIKEFTRPIDVEDFHAITSWAGCLVVLKETGFVGATDGKRVLFTCFAERSLRAMDWEVG